MFEATGDKNKIWPSWEKIQVSFFADVGPEGRRELAANHVVEGAGQAVAGWKLVPEVLSKVCDSFELVLLESLLKES